MGEIHQFREIEDYVKTLSLNVENKFSNFLIYNYENINWDHYDWLSTYRQSYFEVTLDLTEGCNSLIDQFELPSITNRLTMISPHRLQTIKPHGRGMREPHKGYGILFKPEFIHAHSTNSNFLKDLPFFSHFNSPAISLEKNEINPVLNIIREIEHEHDAGSTSSKQIIRHYLNILFLKAKRNYSASAHKTRSISREQEIYDKFKWLVHKHSLEFKSVQEYATKMHITPKHLSETIKKVSGKGALVLIHESQINHAKALLNQTDKTISEIAYELNFSNPEYFSVFFKRLTGTTPSQFRIS